MRSSTWLGILLAVSIVGNAFFLYTLVDHGVSATYQADERARREQQLMVLRALLMEYAKEESKDSLIHRAELIGLNVVDKPGENYFWVGEIRFDTTGAKIADIKLD